MQSDTIWLLLREEATETARDEPVLSELLRVCILDRPSLEEALAYRLARKIGHHAVSEQFLQDTFSEAFKADPKIGQHVRHDLQAVVDRDPATDDYLQPFLYQKGFQALTTYRLAHHLYNDGRKQLAFYLQSLMSEVYQADIHPAAHIGCGIMLDHATSFVVGETAVIANNVSILHEVTLGGTGKEHGDRHPKVGEGVLLAAGSKIIGNVKIGQGAKVGAGAVVLEDVPAHTTVVGVPAQVVGHIEDPAPALGMDQHIECDEPYMGQDI